MIFFIDLVFVCESQSFTICFSLWVQKSWTKWIFKCWENSHNSGEIFSTIKKIVQLSTSREGPGSNPGVLSFFSYFLMGKERRREEKRRKEEEERRREGEEKKKEEKSRIIKIKCWL